MNAERESIGGGKWYGWIFVDPNDDKTVYVPNVGMYRSTDGGKTWGTRGPESIARSFHVDYHGIWKGNIEFCTLTTISESPVTPGVVWVGSDDGKVQVTRDGGGTWADATAAIASAGGPADYFVTRVFASPHREGTALVAKAGWHRDVYAPFVLRTDDYGKTWAALSGGLPDGTVYGIVQDRKHADLLFAGTEMGVHATIDGGKAWFAFGTGLPPYALVHDLLIHPREADLVVATHGRGLFATDLSHLQEVTPAALAEDVRLFGVEPKIQWPRRAIGGSIGGDRQFVAPNEPAGLVISYWLKAAAPGPVTIRITDPSGQRVAQLQGPGAAGLQRVVWDFQRAAQAPAAGAPAPAGTAPGGGGRGGVRLAPPGDYVVYLEIGEKTWSTRAVIRPAPDRQ